MKEGEKKVANHNYLAEKKKNFKEYHPEIHGEKVQSLFFSFHFNINFFENKKARTEILSYFYG